MELTNLSIAQFVDLLASDAPAPGGGSAAALAASLGIALTNMVANLTIGKKKYEKHQELMERVLKEAALIKADLILNIDKDTESFNAVSDVFSMPKETDEDKEKRKIAMELALKGATYVPFDIMTLCLKSLELTEKMLNNSNNNAASDLGVAALTLEAGVKGAWLNVLINIGSIKDEEFVNKYKEDGAKIVAQAEKYAKNIYIAVCGCI